MEDARKSSRVTTKRGYTAWSSGTSSFKILSVSSSASRVWIVRGFYSQAEIQEDMLHMDLSTFQPRQPLSAADLFHSSPHHPTRDIQNLLRRIFTIFDAIAHALKASNGIPTPHAVIEAAMDINTSAVHFCLGKGGRVEYILDAWILQGISRVLGLGRLS